MLKLKEKISEIHHYDPDDNRSELSKFISLAIKYNKKDVSLHQATWKLQDFYFMECSDKFETLNLRNAIS